MRKFILPIAVWPTIRYVALDTWGTKCPECLVPLTADAIGTVVSLKASHITEFHGKS